MVLLDAFDGLTLDLGCALLGRSRQQKRCYQPRPRLGTEYGRPVLAPATVAPTAARCHQSKNNRSILLGFLIKTMGFFPLEANSRSRNFCRMTLSAILNKEDFHCYSYSPLI